MTQTGGSFIDLFSGCGGLSLGLMNAGWTGILAVEHNADAFKTLSHNLINNNNHRESPKFAWPSWIEAQPYEIQSFVEDYKHKLLELRGEVDLVAGGPPCQGFSFAGKRNEKDPRNQLFRAHLDVVSLVRPALVLMENVQGISSAFRADEHLGQRGWHAKSYANVIKDMLEKQGYHVQQNVFRALDYGVPQRRPRYFTLGIREDMINEGASVPELEKIMRDLRHDFLVSSGLDVNMPVTVYDAISDLTMKGKQLRECMDPESPSGFFEIGYEGPITPYQNLMNSGMEGRSPNSMRLVKHRDETVERFKKILTAARKGVQLCEEDRVKFGVKKSVMVPLAPNLPSHTLTTIPDDLLHYSEPRVHTVREYARLQSFPDWFEFRGKFTTGGRRRSTECPRYTQVGNAVPPLLAEIIGEALLVMLRQVDNA